MMKVPPDIPEWGRLPSPLVKASGRTPQPLAKMIETGKRPPLSRILPDSCEKVGGFGDGHTVAASGVFPIGREEAFLEVLDVLAKTVAWQVGNLRTGSKPTHGLKMLRGRSANLQA